MKTTTPDADTSVRRGSCPRNPWVVVLLAALFAFAGLAPALASTNPLVAPDLVPGNPSCTDLGYDFGFKPQAPEGTICEGPPGVFSEDCDANWEDGFDNPYSIPGGEITFLRAEAFPDSDGHVGFESTVPVAGFVIKGGPNANLYDYEGNGLTNVLFDTNLVAPTGPGGIFDISHVEVCLNFSLVVEKTAVGTFDRTFEWEIEKLVDPDAASIFFGDSHAFDYTVTVTNTDVVDSNFEVTGNITITNPFPGIDATNLLVTDLLNDGTTAVVDCPAATVAGGESITCTYTASPDDASATLNTATAAYTMAGASRTSTGTADIDWTANEINRSISFTDTFDGIGPWTCDAITDDGSCTEPYGQIFTCEGVELEEGANSGFRTVENTASITTPGAEDSDDANITLTCWVLNVAKTANPTFTREWFWDVEKTYDRDVETELLAEGQIFSLDYTIVVESLGSEDSDWAVSGTISVTNPATDIDATINSVSDLIEGIGLVDVDCAPATFPYVLGAGETLTCSYGPEELPDGSTRTNTAEAVQRNFNFGANGTVISPAGTSEYRDTVSFSFVNPTTSVNACVDVIDLFSVAGLDPDITQLNDPLVPLCYFAEPEDFVFTFSDNNGGEPWFEPGDFAEDICEIGIDNEAQVITLDDPYEVLNEEQALVQVLLLNANCTPEGCTLTRGYWQTHSAYGPAPYDDNWARVGNIEDEGWEDLGLPGECDPENESLRCGEDTPFFGGDSWINVFWTPPQGGDAYYILAHQFMAATLNVLNGAAIPDHVERAWDAAASLFESCGPGEFVRPRRNQAVTCNRDDAIELAELLDSYNNGYEDVPHCSDYDVHDD